MYNNIDFCNSTSSVNRLSKYIASLNQDDIINNIIEITLILVTCKPEIKSKIHEILHIYQPNEIQIIKILIGIMYRSGLPLPYGRANLYYDKMTLSVMDLLIRCITNEYNLVRLLKICSSHSRVIPTVVLHKIVYHPVLTINGALAPIRKINSMTSDYIELICKRFKSINILLNFKQAIVAAPAEYEHLFSSKRTCRLKQYQIDIIIRNTSVEDVIEIMRPSNLVHLIGNLNTWHFILMSYLYTRLIKCRGFNPHAKDTFGKSLIYYFDQSYTYHLYPTIHNTRELCFILLLFQTSNL